MLALTIGKLMKSLFFGRLRDAEVDLVWDNARYAITETCLALTIFRRNSTCVWPLCLLPYFFPKFSTGSAILA